MTSDVCTVRGHVVSAALANPEAHALIRSSCFEPPNMPGTPAARDRITRAYVCIEALTSSTMIWGHGLFRLKQATFMVEENNFQ